VIVSIVLQRIAVFKDAIDSPFAGSFLSLSLISESCSYFVATRLGPNASVLMIFGGYDVHRHDIINP
jgi:hypothetical protein